MRNGLRNALLTRRVTAVTNGAPTQPNPTPYKSPIHPVSPLRAREAARHLPARPVPAMDGASGAMVGGVR